MNIKDNAQHIAGIIIGKTVLRWTGFRFSKAWRNIPKPFSHVSANLAADGIALPLIMYR